MSRMLKREVIEKENDIKKGASEIKKEMKASTIG
ncbi:hypothetical protein C5S53_08190 [Methanophagales archaeon]|nr:hypothetical protein C5S53_08190 [Methanophagales archaeon]